MRKYQKLYQLKQIIKKDQEYAKYCRLTRKEKHPKEYDERLKQIRLEFFDLVKDMPKFTRFVSDDNRRIRNIAYSMLKGKKYFQVERSVRQGNEIADYEWKKIVEIMEAFKDEENTNEIPQSPFPITQVNEPKKKMEVQS